MSVEKYSSGEEEKTPGKRGFQSTKSMGGEQFVIFHYMVKARVKGMTFSETPVLR